MKWLLRVGALLVVSLLGAAVALFVASERFFARTFPLEVAVPAVPEDDEAIARGKHFGEAVLDCGGCHGVDLGGGASIDNGAIGHLIGPNLTRGKGGIGGQLTRADWVRSIRHGVGRDGRGLIFMSSNAYSSIGDQDLGEVIAWLERLPPVDRELPALSVGPVGRALFLAGALPVTANLIDHAAVEARVKAAAPAADRGQYLAETSGCLTCHGADLKGLTLGDVKSTDITAAGLKGWTKEQFAVAMREGKRPDGTPLNGLMPSVRAFSKLNDDEVDALWQWQQAFR